MDEALHRPTGGNAIGTVGVSSLPALPAGTNAIGVVDTRTSGTSHSTLLPVQEASVTIGADGTGNAIGDVLTFVGGSSTVPVSATQASPGKSTVSAVSSGAVTACAPLSGSLGSYTALPVNPVATTSTGGGSGATINVGYTGLAVQIAAANPSRLGLHIQPQGVLAYMRGAGVPVAADYNALQVPSGALFETPAAFVGTGAVSMITSGTTPLGVNATEY